MFQVDTFTTFLGWCTVINLGVLLFSTFMIMAMHRFITDIHSRMFGIPESELPAIYMRYLANFKVLVLVFNLVPYVALKLM